MDDFATRLLRWFDRYGRHDLPWQRDGSPYHVWLSEIMLQQTQVATVIPYYERFTGTFPDLESLAQAPLDDVLAHWSGLGYYARARNLHRAAMVLVDDYRGQFPADLEKLEGLPGIGRSTAGAILSCALGGRAPILDGNVNRVLARYHAVDGWPGKSAVANALWELAESHTPDERVADYTQAIMDLGATVCTRARPDCARCPQQRQCIAHKQGRESDFPGRKPRRSLPTRRAVFVLALTPAGELFLERRPDAGLWGGLWCFPEVESVDAARNYCHSTLASSVEDYRPLPVIRHSFSHYHLEISPLLLTLSGAPARVAEASSPRSWPLEELPGVGLAAPTRRLWLSAGELLATDDYAIKSADIKSPDKEASAP